MNVRSSKTQVRDEDAITVHLNNPKPWDATVTEAPCNQSFYALWHSDLLAATGQQRTLEL